MTKQLTANQKARINIQLSIISDSQNVKLEALQGRKTPDKLHLAARCDQWIKEAQEEINNIKREG